MENVKFCPVMEAPCKGTECALYIDNNCAFAATAIYTRRTAKAVDDVINSVDNISDILNDR